MTSPPCHGTGSLLLLLLALSHAAEAAAIGDACAAMPFKTLSFDCPSSCDSGDSCLVFNASEESPCKYNESEISPRAHVCNRGSASVSCDVMCFEPSKNNSRAFKFYVAFNKSRATVPPPAGSSATPTADMLSDLTDDVPYETNAFVRRIGRLNLPSHISEVVISGGRATTGSRGTVVNLDIDPEMLANASHVTAVSLLNMDLNDTKSTIAALLPRYLRALDLSNTKLTDVAPSIQDLSKLETLTLNTNFLVEFPVSLNLPALRTLRLRDNKLSSFATIMTSIELLDLVANDLSTFPYGVLSWDKLHTLHVERNEPMAKVVFTESHIAKLSALEAFSMDSAALDASSCPPAQLRLLPPNRNVSVCVLSEADWAKYQTQLDGSQRRVELPTSNSSTNTTKVIVLAIFICVAALAVVLVWRKCQSKPGKSLECSASSVNGTVDQDVHSNDIHFGKLITTKASDVAVSSQLGHQLSRQLSRQLSGNSSSSSPHKRYTLHSDESLVSRRLRLDHIEDLRVIGSGGFAVVWLVRYLPQDRFFASKRLIKDQVTRQKTMDFVMEIKLNMQLEHPNIVQLSGVAWTIETDLQALLEYMPNGDLRAHLESTTQTKWDEKKIQLAIDIVEALVYVHSFSPPLVHRDLKSRNVLLAEDMKAKLCDFGVSRFASVSNTMTTAVGTGKWLAPEVVAGSKSYDQSCDVYALGVIMTELDTHRLPFDDVMGPQGDRLPEVAILQLVSCGQLQPTLSASCPEEIRRIALQCLAFDPADRPTALQVAHWLRTLANGSLRCTTTA